MTFQTLWKQYHELRNAVEDTEQDHIWLHKEHWLNQGLLPINGKVVSVCDAHRAGTLLSKPKAIYVEAYNESAVNCETCALYLSARLIVPIEQFGGTSMD